MSKKVPLPNRPISHSKTNPPDSCVKRWAVFKGGNPWGIEMLHSGCPQGTLGIIPLSLVGDWNMAG